MDIIGPDCENIINEYVWQIDHVKKFKDSLHDIKTGFIYKKPNLFLQKIRVE